MTPEQIKQYAKEGAREALKELGLDDNDAPEDIKAIRGWLDGYRMIKRTAVKTTARMFTVGFWLLLMGGAITWISTQLSKIPH